MKDSNKAKATSFLEMVASGKVDTAYQEFVAAGFKHHNPFFEGSADALRTAMKENAEQNPHKAIDVKRVIAEDEYVVVHFLVNHQPGDLGAAVIHIFRFENGRIVELWDLGQPMPEKSVNENGMF